MKTDPAGFRTLFTSKISSAIPDRNAFFSDNNLCVGTGFSSSSISLAVRLPPVFVTGSAVDLPNQSADLGRQIWNLVPSEHSSDVDRLIAICSISLIGRFGVGKNAVSCLRRSVTGGVALIGLRHSRCQVTGGSSVVREPGVVTAVFWHITRSLFPLSSDCSLAGFSFLSGSDSRCNGRCIFFKFPS